MKSTETEECIFRILAKRDHISTKPDDPEREQAILKEWWSVVVLMEKWRGVTEIFDD